MFKACTLGAYFGLIGLAAWSCYKALAAFSRGDMVWMVFWLCVALWCAGSVVREWLLELEPDHDGIGQCCGCGSEMEQQSDKDYHCQKCNIRHWGQSDGNQDV